MSKRPKSPQKRYATIANPTIQAITHELYRLPSEAEAKAKLAALTRHFILSRQQLRNEAHPSVHLWIKGYAVSEQDKTQGITGHFALVSYRQEGARWVLYASKLDTPANTHPQRLQVKRDNPNWGHPVLRAIRKGKTYQTLEQAQAELNLLHEHFPKVSIPNPGKLYLMIYCSSRPAKERMVKHKLEIIANPDGTYRLDCQENIRKPAASKPPTPEPAAPQGYFIAKVTLARSRKKKKPPAT